MDQNRCLLDVIDNPQLLQSFLESESSARTSGNQQNQPIAHASETLSNANVTTKTTTTSNSTTPVENLRRFEQQDITSNTSVQPEPIREPSPVIDSLHNSYFGFNNHTDFNNPDADPVVSVLDSIISDTVAEASPTTQDADAAPISAETADCTNFTTNITTSTNPAPVNNSTSPTPHHDLMSKIETNETPTVIDQTSLTNSGTPNSIYVSNNVETLLDANDTNNNSTSSSDDNSTNLLVDEFYAHQTPTKIPSDGPLLTQQVQTTIIQQELSQTTTTSIANENPILSGATNTIKLEIDAPTVDQHENNERASPKIEIQPQDPSKSQNVQEEQQPSQNIDNTNKPPLVENSGPEQKVMNTLPTMIAPKSNNGSPSNRGNVTKTPETKPKRAPRTKKNAKTSAASITPSKSPATTTNQPKPMQTQYITNPQQQIVYQNNGIRPQTMLAQSPMVQPMSGVPQQQRVIQIQTANGPMYFAIAPGPAAMNNNSVVNQQQQQQQPGMKSQFPSQQICFQPNSNMILNRPQMASPMTQQHLPQQQTEQQQSQPQQQQHVVLPSSQPVMMPRAPNQLVVNRQPGQLLPGQQQFIQILTPNGPMLLALPTQQAQPMGNTMLDYNNSQSIRQTIPVQQNHQQMQQATQHTRSLDVTDGSGTPSKQANSNSSKRSGLDLADLLLDCGILPDDRAGSQSSNSIKSSQSPSISQISSPIPNMPQISSPLPTTEPNSLPSNHTPQPVPNYHPVQPTMQQQQQHPVRIAFGPDGQMIMQPAVYGAIRPVLASPQMNTSTTGPNMMPNSPMMVLTPNASNPSTPNNNNNGLITTSESTKKGGPKAKGTATKRSRSKKSDIDNFPQLKTPKIAQQQQQQQQQQMQAVTVVPMTVVVGDQNKVLAAGPDVKPNVTQLASGQQVSVAKFVTPVMQTAPLQSSVSSNLIQTSVAPAVTILGNQTISHSQQQINPTNILNSQQNPSDMGNNINAANAQQQQNSATLGSAVTTTSSDTLKFEQNGQTDGQGHNQQQIKGIQFQGIGGVTTTLVLKTLTPQQQQQHQQQLLQQQQLQQQQSQAQLQQQQLARQLELRSQSILNQLGADQNAALNPQTKQPFLSIEDACKRLLRYHVFDTKPVNESNIRQVDEIFEAAVESLITRKQAIYDKFRLLILKKSMRTVPTSDEVMLDKLFVNDELAFLKRERELFKEYEAHLESMAIKQAKADSELDTNKDDCASDYFAFGTNSPRHKSRRDDHMVNPTHSRDADDWLMNDKWGESRFPSVPDSEAATAIESILNEEIS